MNLKGRLFRKGTGVMTSSTMITPKESAGGRVKARDFGVL